MDRLPQLLYTASQTRELDRSAIEAHAIPGGELMDRAGRAAYRLLRDTWPRARRLVIVAGSGNNGGDGYVLARAALADGFAVTVCAPTPAKTPDAQAAAQAYQAAGGEVDATLNDAVLTAADVIVDAVFGTGLEQEVRGPWRDVIRQINHSGTPVLALDIPSGVHADTGAVLGVAVHAAATVSFIGCKVGLFFGTGRAHAGAIYFDDLDVPAEVYADINPVARRCDVAGLRDRLKPRRRDAHKGDFGHVLVIGGNLGMPGAVRMAAAAAYRVGAGLVTVATRAAHASVIPQTRPELICHGVETTADLRGLLAAADVIAIGPGLGQDEWARRVWGTILETSQTLVVDADALNLLALEPSAREAWVLTPHPGEAGRLLGRTAAAIQQDRLRAAADLNARYGGVTVLKGAGTLVTHDNQTVLCDRGNPGMASGGMGDVLSGAIAGLIAQGLAPAHAAELGVYTHAVAGDRAAQEGGEIGLLAGDVLAHLRAVRNELTA